MNQPKNPPPKAKAATSTGDVKLAPELDDDFEPSTWNRLIHKISGMGLSVLLHTIILLILAIVTIDTSIIKNIELVALPRLEDDEDPPVEIELDPEIDVVPPESVSLFTATPAALSSSSEAAAVPVLDQSLVAIAETSDLQIDAPTLSMPDSMALIEAIPDGDVKGESRDIVKDYQHAMDRIAQELLWMLDEGPVLAVWCFDQSQSMKDDQKEIRDRIHSVYAQLGLDERSKNSALMTAVTSYGQGFVDHTAHRPTPNLDVIKKAIDEVPVDKSGLELMCGAVGRSINTYRDQARRGRQMALILVTDESGQPQNNDQYLEQAIQIARAAECKVYVLGRESVFGYPYAFIRWRHPQTKRRHWLRIDRGPETGFPEQLQTNGFRRRRDAFSSGFGPYEQSRLARETNGIFFMLPTVEKNLVRASKVQYDLEALRPYRPDLRAKKEVFLDRHEVPLRQLIWKVIKDLNPHVPESKGVVELRLNFSLKPESFLTQARQNQEKALLHLQYMAKAEKALQDGKKLREQEADPRWQANYDLILAQLIAYQARVYEYGVALEAFIKNPKQAPAKKGTLVLHDWEVHTVKKTRTEEAKPYIERATSMLARIKREHPGSPWAARADWELRRGFGCDVRPDYDVPYIKVEKPIPPPNL